MHRFAPVVSLLAISCLAGCGQEQPVPMTNSFNLFGDRYYVDIESVGSTHVTSYVDNRVDGDKQVKEFAEYKWNGNTLRLDMGKVTYNDKEYGTVKQGDRVRVDKDGQLFVNGELKQ